MIDFSKLKLGIQKVFSVEEHVERAAAINAWGGVEPFFNKDTAPKFFDRSNMEFATLPMSYLKSQGLWHEKLDELLPILPEGAYIAGGFLRGIMAGEKEITGDIDFFFNGSMAMTTMYDMIANPKTDELKRLFSGYQTNNYFIDDSKNYRLVDFVDNVGNKPKLQLVKLVWFTDPCHVIDSFDFTVVQFVTDGKTLYYNPNSIEDLKNRSLKLHKSQSPIFTLNRILKYIEKGYNADPVEFKTVADEAVALLLTADTKKLEDYFYIPKSANYLAPVVIEPIPKAWLGRVWKYLGEGDGASRIFAQIFGSKEVEQEIVEQDPL